MDTGPLQTSQRAAFPPIEPICVGPRSQNNISVVFERMKVEGRAANLRIARANAEAPLCAMPP